MRYCWPLPHPDPLLKRAGIIAQADRQFMGDLSARVLVHSHLHPGAYLVVAVGCVAQLLAVILVRDVGEGIQTKLVEVTQVSFALS